MESHRLCFGRELIVKSLMRLPQVRAATGYGTSSIYKLMGERKFPRPIKLAGGGAVAWREADVQAWIDEQGQQQEQPATPKRRRTA